jgi:(4-(4-[2-(gamma-L-glutamylamino)ethyl]phenoxymethyl)furan-2-yl)methanamine synthase
MKRVVGLDIGGANLKAAVDGDARVRPFALWRNPGGLSRKLAALLRGLPAWDALAVTMTGELCDCYESRRQGVQAILDAVEAVAAGRPILVWGTDGRFASVAETRENPLRAASANWLALATFAGRFAPKGPALLLDVGSTTTDLVPLRDGRPVPGGLTDADRLRLGELVYTGVRRTPVCTLVCALMGDAVAAELFATTLDVYLVLGDLAEGRSRDTADGRPATVALARARLARMLGGDAETCPEVETTALACRAASAQRALLRRAFREVADRLGRRLRKVVLAGSGEFLARKVLRPKPVPVGEVVSLAEWLGPGLSTAACAHAVATLAAQGGQAHG